MASFGSKEWRALARWRAAELPRPCPNPVKQILQSYRTGELWLADVPAPRLGPESVLVATTCSVVSPGTEKMILDLAKKSLLQKARARPDLVKKVLQKIKSEGLGSALQKTFAKLDTPIPLGYSAAGTVLACGEHVHELRPGDRVACGGAGYASHAEVLSVPRNLCAKVPDGVALEDAAFATIGAIAMQGVRQADLRLGERAVVVGLGLLGLLTVQLLRASGCRVLGVDLDPGRAALAAELGADATATTDAVEQALHMSDGRGADAVLLTAATSSNGPIESAPDMLRHRGRVVVVGSVGMNVPRDPFYKKELELRLSMSYGPGRYDPNYEERGREYPIGHVRWTEQRNLSSFVELVGRGAVTPQRLVTHRYPIDQGLAAYETLQDAAAKPMGILLSYPDAAEAARASMAARRVALEPAQQPASSGGLRFGVLGAGGYAKGVLLPGLAKLPDAMLATLCTASGSSASETGKKFGFGHATTSADEVFGDPAIDAVVIATRHDSHASYVCEALRRGKHVLVEKPLCLSREELAEVEQVLAELGAERPILTVGFNRRFSPHTAALRSCFADRTTPLVIDYRVQAGRIQDDHWVHDPEEGGGRLLGECCHFVDWCRAMVGAPIRAVRALGAAGTSAEHPTSDAAVLSLMFEDGSLASITYATDGHRAVAKERVEVHGGGISAVVDDWRAVQWHGHRGPKAARGQQKGVAEMLAAFAAAVRGGEAPIPEEELLEVQRALLDAHAALRGTGPEDAGGSE